MRLACQEHLLPGDGMVEKWEFAPSAASTASSCAARDDLRRRLPELRRAGAGRRVVDRLRGSPTASSATSTRRAAATRSRT